MNWFARHRSDWILEMLVVYGFIGRAHLMRKFGISAPQATLDFRAFLAEHPDAMEYDPREKVYKAKRIDSSKLTPRDDGGCC